MKVYCVQVSGIKCTNCAEKITKKLQEVMATIGEPQGTISVNIMQEKVNLAIKNESSLTPLLAALTDLQFRPLADPILISTGDGRQRTAVFVVPVQQDSQSLKPKLSAMAGITSVGTLHFGKNIKLSINYDSFIVKGRTIYDVLRESTGEVTVLNQRVLSFMKHSVAKQDEPSIALTAFLALFFLLFNMVLPFSGQWYEKMVVYPRGFGVMSFAVLLNIMLTLYILKVYALGFVRRAYKNYVVHRSTNMETLVALGSVSAFFLASFFFVRYNIHFFDGDLTDSMSMEGVMSINDALTSASIIVLVVTLGKHFENKVKGKINSLTDRIFPQSQLFSDMIVEVVEVRNRQLKALSSELYDVGLVQKDDILRPKRGRQLVDAIVIQGTVRAVQSTTSGCEDIVTLSRGERIQSGAMIEETSPDALLQVENVFEQSMLIQIGTQIKLAENQQQNSQTGIQAVCKKVANHFVIAVIWLSIITMAIWFTLLVFEYVTIPTCNICWVVERGIGVLVASCPCALGLAVPSVIAIILNLATKSGILIRSNSVFQSMKGCRVVTFDKTGTLFTRIKSIQNYHVLSETFPVQTLWQIVALIQKEFKHPLAEALYREAFTKSQVLGANYSYLLLNTPKIDGNGVVGEVCEKVSLNKHTVLIGNKNILLNHGIKVPSVETEGEAATCLFVAVSGEVCLAIFMNTHSNLRPEAGQVVQALQKEGLMVHILSGDSQESVTKLGHQLQIPSECLHPEHSAFMKLQWIKKTQETTSSVVMIGDGLNDIPCLQEAAVGVSINAKSELNLKAADVIILNENLHKILALVRLIRRGNQFIKINLFWAFAYNIVMMPVVAGVFYKFDFYISPIWSSVAMSASSIIVVGFSHLLTFFHYDDSLTAKPKNVSASNVKLSAESKTVSPIGVYHNLGEEMEFSTFKESGRGAPMSQSIG